MNYVLRKYYRDIQEIIEQKGRKGGLPLVFVVLVLRVSLVYFLDSIDPFTEGKASSTVST
jgi:hypothetical protein